MSEAIEISAARAGEPEWCARVMASSDPWITLGRNFDDCLGRLTHPEYRLLVARIADAPAGFVLLHRRGFAGSPYIAAIAVGAGHRGCGIGTALLERAEQEFPARFVFLLVSSFNERARALYERFGYRRIGEIENYVVEGASEIVMSKRLA